MDVSAGGISRRPADEYLIVKALQELVCIHATTLVQTPETFKLVKALQELVCIHARPARANDLGAAGR
jgi:hypothetical protein